MRTTARVRGVSDRAHAWVDHREPGSRSATAIDVWRRYREVDGPLQSALLSLYVVVAIVPALLVTEEFFDSNPRRGPSKIWLGTVCLSYCPSGGSHNST